MVEQIIDTRRHLSIFDPIAFGGYGHRVSIIGANELAQKLSRHIAQLGLNHSLFGCEQIQGATPGIFGLDTASGSCAKELERIVARDTGLQLDAYERAPAPGDVLGNVIFLCTNDPTQRQEIVRRLNYDFSRISLLVDIQTTPTGTRFFFLNPSWRWQLQRYYQWLEKGSDLPRTNLALVNEYSAALATLQLTEWFANWLEYQQGNVPQERLPQQLYYSLRASNTVSERLYEYLAKFESGNNRISVVGAGALGSRVGRLLASLGFSFELWDDDRVEAHNVPNQAFGLPEIGQYKCEALAQIVQRDYGVKLTVRKEQFDCNKSLGNIVFVCPDNMVCRSAVWHSVRLKQDASLVVEGRMGDVWGKVFTAFPRNTAHFRGYAKTLHSDAVAHQPDAGACQAVTSVGATAECIASRMVGQLLRWLLSSDDERRFIDHSMIEYLRPYHLSRRNFS